MGGGPMVLAASKWNILTSQLEGSWLAVAFLLFAVSLATVKRIELRVAAVYVCLFSFALLLFGRPDNDYWGIMFAPFLAVGLPTLWRGEWRAGRRECSRVESSPLDHSDGTDMAV